MVRTKTRDCSSETSQEWRPHNFRAPMQYSVGAIPCRVDKLSFRTCFKPRRIFFEFSIVLELSEWWQVKVSRLPWQKWSGIPWENFVRKIKPPDVKVQCKTSANVPMTLYKQISWIFTTPLHWVRWWNVDEAWQAKQSFPKTWEQLCWDDREARHKSTTIVECNHAVRKSE